MPKEKFPADMQVEGGGIPDESRDGWIRNFREHNFSDKEIDEILHWSNEAYRARVAVDEAKAEEILATLSKRHPDWADGKKVEIRKLIGEQLRSYRLPSEEADETPQ